MTGKDAGLDRTYDSLEDVAKKSGFEIVKSLCTLDEVRPSVEIINLNQVHKRGDDIEFNDWMTKT